MLVLLISLLALFASLTEAAKPQNLHTQTHAAFSNPIQWHSISAFDELMDNATSITPSFALDSSLSKKSFASPLALPSIDFVESVQVQPDSCAPCIQTWTNHSINSSVEYLVSYCLTNATTPRARKACDFALTHLNFTIGLIWYKTAPIYSSYLYCSGKGECYIHGIQPNASTLIQNGPNNAAELVIAQGLEQMSREIDFHQTACSSLHAATFSVPSLDADSSIWHVAFNEVAERPETPLRAGARVFGPHRVSDRCKNCIKLTVHGILLSIFAKISWYCQKHTDPNSQKLCDFIRQNQAFSAGYIYGKVAPQKFAIGNCVGNGACLLGTGMNEFELI